MLERQYNTCFAFIGYKTTQAVLLLGTFNFASIWNPYQTARSEHKALDIYSHKTRRNGQHGHSYLRVGFRVQFCKYNDKPFQGRTVSQFLNFFFFCNFLPKFFLTVCSLSSGVNVRRKRYNRVYKDTPTISVLIKEKNFAILIPQNQEQITSLHLPMAHNSCK